MGLTCHHPPLPNKPGTNWVEKAGGLPKYIDCRARAIFWGGKARDESHAIAIAVGVTEDEAAGKRKVTPKTRTLAAAAVAEWDAKRARAKAT